MKITRENWLKATANAMNRKSTKELTEKSPISFDLFSIFSYRVWLAVDGKNLTEDCIAEAASSVVIDMIKVGDSPEKSFILTFALIKFVSQIYQELLKTDKQTRKNPEYENIKSELKSKQK